MCGWWQGALSFYFPPCRLRSVPSVLLSISHHRSSPHILYDLKCFHISSVGNCPFKKCPFFVKFGIKPCLGRIFVPVWYFSLDHFFFSFLPRMIDWYHSLYSTIRSVYHQNHSTTHLFLYPPLSKGICLDLPTAPFTFAATPLKPSWNEVFL